MTASYSNEKQENPPNDEEKRIAQNLTADTQGATSVVVKM